MSKETFVAYSKTSGKPQHFLYLVDYNEAIKRGTCSPTPINIGGGEPVENVGAVSKEVPKKAEDKLSEEVPKKAEADAHKFPGKIRSREK